MAAMAMMLASCGGNSDTNATPADEAEIDSATAAEVDSINASLNVVVDASPDMKIDRKPEKPIVLDFSALWCRPCNQFAPIFREVASAHRDKASFISVNVNDCPDIADEFFIEVIPTIVIIMPDGTTRRTTGYMSYKEFNDIISKL